MNLKEKIWYIEIDIDKLLNDVNRKYGYDVTCKKAIEFTNIRKNFNGLKKLTRLNSFKLKLLLMLK